MCVLRQVPKRVGRTFFHADPRLFAAERTSYTQTKFVVCFALTIDELDEADNEMNESACANDCCEMNANRKFGLISLTSGTMDGTRWWKEPNFI